MADSHPYISGPGNISQMITHLRKSFPKTISSDTVKRLGLAPKNESYVINALQFVGIIDEEGKKTTEATKVFSSHKDEEFSKAFSGLIEKSYSALFDLYGEGAWDLDLDDLITFFRSNDQTSDAIGRRQAKTFRVFAGLSGHGEVPAAKAGGTKTTKKSAKKATKKKTETKNDKESESTVTKTKDFGLTVRVEINLPSDGTKETYDNIFKSIKENLIDG